MDLLGSWDHLLVYKRPTKPATLKHAILDGADGIYGGHANRSAAALEHGSTSRGLNKARWLSHECSSIDLRWGGPFLC